MFVNYPLDMSDWAAALEGLRVTTIDLEDDTHYAMRLVTVPGRRLSLLLGYHPAVFEHAEAEQLVVRLTRILKAMAANPDGLVRDINSVTPMERERLLLEWGGYN
jgi:hypothetical protein